MGLGYHGGFCKSRGDMIGVGKQQKMSIFILVDTEERLASLILQTDVGRVRQTALADWLPAGQGQQLDFCPSSTAILSFMRSAWPSRHCQWPLTCIQSLRHSSHSSSRLYSQISAETAQKRIAKQAPRESHKSSKAGGKDNRAIVSSHELYALHPSSPGSPLFHPYGTHILLKLQAFLRAQYPRYGFQEVISPIIYKKSLWEISGHWDNYKDDMFAVTGRGAQGGHDPEREIGEDEEYGLKPMNCPGHCLLYKSQRRSYKDLPLRFADFSPLHRNELSGALSGMTRLRRFHQDDGHIFCEHSQIEQEIRKTLSFVRTVYQTFDLGNYKLRLGTRPEQFVGYEEDWTRAEARLKNALEESRRDFYIEHGGGAFYGPKIDIILTDADGKDHQTATIQLDFQLPARFRLEYDTPKKSFIPGSGFQTTGASGTGASETQQQRPVLIHRAILGSLERFMALLAESYGGKWPFWMNPRQLAILTVGKSEKVQRRAEKLVHQLSSPDFQEGARKLTARNFMVDCDSSDQSVAKKIVDARKKGYTFYTIIGERNLEQPLQEQKLDLTLVSHPKPQEVHEALRGILQLQTPANPTETQGGKTDTKDTAVGLNVRQCQDYMTELDSKFL